MSVPQNTGLILFVTHVDTDDLFLKIWGQVDKNSATCVERMILPLQEQFAQSPGCVGPQAANLRINALCCARFQHEGYYRARVINVRADGMVVLQFIDYGNVEVLPPQEIHLLDNITGSESLQSFPPVACHFTLMNVLPLNGTWENKIVESIKKTLWYNEYKILVAPPVVGHHRFIKLFYNNEDFSELLVKKQMAIPATIQDMLRCVQQPQLAVYQQLSKLTQNNNVASLPSVPNTVLNPLRCEESNSHVLPQTVPPCCPAQQKHMAQVAPVQEALVFKSRVLDVGTKHNVFVSFVEDGPQKFSVQVQDKASELSQLMRDINIHPIQSLQEPPLPGAVCLGRYTQDKVLCRAVVMSVMENKCKLYYVDFGHTEILPYTDIFQLPPHYINPRVLSIRFTLSGIKELNVTEEMKEYFRKIVSGKSLVLHVRPPEGPPLVQYGDLYDNGQNVKDILRQAFPAPTAVSPVMPLTYKEPRKLLTGTEEIVHVSFVESCSKFFIQIESELKSLESVMNYLAEFCMTAPILNPTQIRVGLPCAAMYEDQWYRAQVLNVTANNVKVIYVDYGNEETVTSKSLRAIHDDLVKKLQAQAIKCILNGWEQLPATEEICSQFELLTIEKQLRMRVVDVHSDAMVVDLYDPETMDDIKNQLSNMMGNEKNSSPLTANATMHHSPVSQSELSTESPNKWRKKNQSDSWRQPQNGIAGQERNKPKTWKNEFNEEKQHDNKSEKSHFYRSDARPERFNRDDFSDNRNTKDRWNNKYEHNDSAPFKSGRNSRDGRSRTAGSTSKHNNSGGSDKSWSDKDSDTSSRSSGKHRRENSNYSGYSKRDGASGKPYSNRWNDKENDRGNYKGGKMSDGDFYHGNNKFKDRKGQGHRITHSKLNTVEEGGRCSSVQNVNQFRIPPPSITIGTTETCEIVFAHSPSDFFLQLSSNYDSLDSIMESIASMYENGGELIKSHQVSNGASCIAQYTEDLKWYRAEIKSVEGNRSTVQFVDYGNTEAVELEQIKCIEKEFLKLPSQAVHCKLFGVRDIGPGENETKTFADKTSGKTLQAEFILLDNEIYSVLLREIVEGVPAAGFINEEFSEGVDLLKAKDEAINKRKPTGSIKQSIQPDYASVDAEWATTTYEAGTKKDVIITWFTNPNNFYCQTLDKNDEFRTMMNEMQKMYVGREPVSYTLKVGSPVIAIFSDDGALYRAEIVELNPWNGHVVRYIDFGNIATVEVKKIYPVEKKLMQLPKLASHCSLMGITPKDGVNWSTLNTKAVDDCFNADKYECIFHDLKNNKYLISLNYNGNDIGNLLVEKNLVARAISEPVIVADESVNANPASQYHVEKVDISLLSGQVLRVKVSNIENACKFHIQLSSASETESMINEYMADKDPKVLALPGDLSVMQNQAIECSLLDVPSSPEGTTKLKDRVEGKDVIIHVHEVDNNRLIVKLFDLLGNKININEETDETISPICPMPILSSTHKVAVSYADHSASIWLQRNSEYELETNLIQALQQFYPDSGQPLEPKINVLCAAKSTDGQWYRGKIIETKENVAYVNFIDYGNTEEISFDNVVTLDSQFYAPHQLAINVSLSVTLNVAPSDQVELLQTHLSNKELTAVFYNINKKWIVELLDNGEKMSEKFRSLNLVTELQAKESQIHNMTVGCKYDVYVSHADSPSQFWLQCVNEADDLAKKQEELQEQASTFPLIDGILEEGSLCIAVYSIDNLWYRAQVLDADEDITTVRFIDYGNTDVITNKTECIRQMPDSWKQIKEYALKCRLDVIPIDSEDWNSTACKSFTDLVASAESLQVSAIANSTPKRVDLFLNDKSISELLVEEGHAVRINNDEDLIDEIVDLELDPHSAFVSHVNSPNEFWVQEEKFVDCLETISDRLIVAPMFQKLDEFKKDSLCVAKYSEDGQWYRARIGGHSDQGTEVIFIDYGNSAISVDVSVIPDDLVDLPPLSRKCCLALPEGTKEWSDTACEEFIKLAANGATIFLLHVLKEDETSLVKLTLDGKDVSELLAEFCERHPSTIEERLPPLGEENSPNVHVNHVNTPDDFWIQTDSSTAELEAMLDRLQLADSFLPLNTFDIGSICAAKYPEDEQWYRAKILSHSESGTEVLYIDYGNLACTTELRMLPIEIINMPPLSKHCALQKPDTIEFWAEEACKVFKELAAEGNTIFQMEILDHGDLTLVKLSHNGNNVVDILAPLCGNSSSEKSVTKNELDFHEDTEARSEAIEENFSEETAVKKVEGDVSDKENDTKCEITESQALQIYSSAVNHSQENIENQNQENINIEVQRENHNLLTDSDAKLILENMIQEIEQKTDKADENVALNEPSSTADKERAIAGTALELTVDEIIQNMNRSVTEDTEEVQTVKVTDDAEEVDEIYYDTESTNLELVKVCAMSVVAEQESIKPVDDTIDSENLKEEIANPETDDKIVLGNLEEETVTNLESLKAVNKTQLIADETEMIDAGTEEFTESQEVEAKIDMIKDKSETVEADTTESSQLTKDDVALTSIEEETADSIPNVDVESEIKTVGADESRQLTQDELVPTNIVEAREDQTSTIDVEAVSKTVDTEESTQLPKDEVVPTNIVEETEDEIPKTDVECQMKTVDAEESTQLPKDEVVPTNIVEETEDQIPKIDVKLQIKAIDTEESTHLPKDEVALKSTEDEIKDQTPTVDIEPEIKTADTQELTQANDDVVSEDMKQETKSNVQQPETDNQTQMIDSKLKTQVSKSDTEISTDRSKIEDAESKESSDKVAELPETNEATETASNPAGNREVSDKRSVSNISDETTEGNGEKSTRKDINPDCSKRESTNANEHSVVKSVDATEKVESEESNVPEEETLSISVERSTLDDKTISEIAREDSKDKDSSETKEIQQSSE